MEAVSMQERLEGMGMAGERVAIMPTDAILQIMREGVIVTVHVKRWRGITSLTPDDLGIRLPEEPKAREAVLNLLNLGDKKLLPREDLNKLRSLEQRARYNLDSCSLATPFGRFVTAAKWAEFKSNHEEIKAEYFRIRDKVVSTLENIKAEVSQTYYQLAAIAYARLSRQEEQALSLESFSAQYVERIMARYPTPEYIEQSFDMSYTPVFIPLPSYIAEDESLAGAIREESALAEALKNDVNRYWRSQQYQLIDNFLADIVGQIRGQVFQSVTLALEAYERQGALPGKTVSGLQTLISNVRALDVYGDTEMEIAFRKLETMLTIPAKDRDQGSIVSSLQALETITRATLLELDKMPRASRNESPFSAEEPTAPELARARRNLGIEAADIPLAVTDLVTRGRRSL